MHGGLRALRRGRAREAVTTPGRLGGGASVGDPYKNLGAKVVAYLRPKAIPLLYDSSVNSPLTARLNVYQNFLVAAVKLHCYVAATAPRPSGTRGPCAARVCAALAEGIGYMERATERASARGVFGERTEGNEGNERRKTKGERRRAVAKTHVRFLGLSAFLATFSRKKVGTPGRCTRCAPRWRRRRCARARGDSNRCSRTRGTTCSGRYGFKLPDGFKLRGRRRAPLRFTGGEGSRETSDESRGQVAEARKKKRGSERRTYRIRRKKPSSRTLRTFFFPKRP